MCAKHAVNLPSSRSVVKGGGGGGGHGRLLTALETHIVSHLPESH